MERLKAARTQRVKAARPVLGWVAALAVAAQGAIHNLSRPLAERLPDLHIYTLAVTALVHGGSLYMLHQGEAARFTYPPFAGLAFFPIAYLPEPVTRVLWTLLTIAAVAVLCWVVTTRLPRRLGPREVVWPLVTALVLASKPVQSNLWFGQISVLLTLAVVADVLAFSGRRGQGVLTGIAAAIKLTPLVF
ncbi:MAG TPA: glycosyltransferase 87 family protein, partial [Actinomycetota bacterium]|nr:glycosyltransferase 87 family protein [Actinomycetota bacterium]